MLVRSFQMLIRAITSGQISAHVSIDSRVSTKRVTAPHPKLSHAVPCASFLRMFPSSSCRHWSFRSPLVRSPTAVGGLVCVCVQSCFQGHYSSSRSTLPYESSNHCTVAGGQRMASRRWPTKLVMSWEAVRDV